MSPLDFLRETFSCASIISSMDTSCETIIVAVDDSEAAKRAVEAALGVARAGDTLAFVHALDTMSVCLPVAEGALIDPTPMLDALLEDANALCGRAVAQARARGITAHTHVIDGPPAESIRRFAADSHARLIVMGTHARTGMARVMNGSVAESVLRLSDVPVLIVHADDARRLGPVAVALDDSEPAHAAFDTALRIAVESAQRLEIIHVKPTLERFESPPFLAAYADAARAAGVSFGTTLCSGNIADEIVSTVEALGCSAIVIGTHGRNSLQRLVQHSIANRVVETARVPVTVIRTAAVTSDVPQPVSP